MIKDSWFDVWEMIFGMIFMLGELYEKDCWVFEVVYVYDWIVILVIMLKYVVGFVEVIVMLGGKCGVGIEECCFFVFLDEYWVGCFGFVIDFVCYDVYGGEFDFIGW